MVAPLGAPDSYEACDYIHLVMLAVGTISLWLRLSGNPSDLSFTLGRSESRKRHNPDPWGPNSQEASALSGRCFAGHSNFGYLLPAPLNQKALLTSCNRSTS